jgi:hypothetical protein
MQRHSYATDPSPMPIVAIQPGTRIDIEKDFYRVPIKHHEDLYLQDRPARLFEVASVPLDAGGQGEGTAARPFRTGIVFVMDATQSMWPYIERTVPSCSASTRPSRAPACAASELRSERLPGPSGRPHG